LPTEWQDQVPRVTQQNTKEGTFGMDSTLEIWSFFFVKKKKKKKKRSKIISR
jgi:hypothetical protein